MATPQYPPCVTKLDDARRARSDIEMRALLGDGEAIDQWNGDIAASPCTHYANALRLRRHFGDRLMHVAGVGWHVWGPPWRLDEPAAMRMAQQLGRIIAEEAAQKADAAVSAPAGQGRKLLHAEAAALMKWASASEAANCIADSMRMAAVLDGIACTPRELNVDPWQLASPAEVVDLRTGEVREHRQSDRITRSTGTHLDARAPRVHFDAMMARIFRSNLGVIPYLQRFLGYALTGRTHPEVMPVWYGTGGNGKSTLSKIMQHVFGDYAGPAPPGLLTLHRGDRHPTELADLQGMRLLVACETEEGARLNEALVKQLTGSDPLKARRMHQDFFQFDPTHKFILLTNHRPVIKGTDVGIWRRLHLVPFVEVIAAEERIDGIDEKLRAEAPAILAWVVEGALRYAKDGRVDPPPEVVAASDAYREDSDVLGGFLSDCCLLEVGAIATAAELFRAYQRWCDDNNEQPMRQRTFGEALSERGIGSDKGTRGVRRRVGIRLVAQVAQVARNSACSYGDFGYDENTDSAPPSATYATPTDWLTARLAGGPAPSNDVWSEAEAVGIDGEALLKAANELRVHAVGDDCWELPSCPH